METNVAAVTVNTVLPVTVPLAALIVVVPAVSVVARPLLPAALLTVATAGFEEVQVTCAVRF
jgi:hypothetical protein